MPDLNYHGTVVAFDLDDTLFRERDFCRSGFRFLCDSALYRVSDNLVNLPEESLRHLVSQMDEELNHKRNPFVPFEEFFKPLVEDKGEEWNLDRHIAAYRTHLPKNLKFAEGAEETLNCLARRGVRMAVITDGRSVTQRRKIEALALNRFVAPDLILISGETGHDKHEKHMFATVVREFPEANKFVYVGDNVSKDFYYPNLMGWLSVQAPPDDDNVHMNQVAKSCLYEPKIKLEKFDYLCNYL